MPDPLDLVQTRKALRLFQHLPLDNQTQVCLAATGALKADLELQALLLQNAPSLHIFRLVASNRHHRYATPLLEQYLFTLLNAGNMTAATSFLHMVMDRFHYSFSHQMWSFFASRAISLGHYASAIMVFHELVDPGPPDAAHVPRGHGRPNPHVPFLLLPTAIEALCVLYKQNGNYYLVQGLCEYFDHYYSRVGHRDVYQTLCIARVETLLHQRNLGSALRAYSNLAADYRGYDRYEDPKKHLAALMYAAHLNHKQNEFNIKYNVCEPSGDHGKSNADDGGAKKPSPENQPVYSGSDRSKAGNSISGTGNSDDSYTESNPVIVSELKLRDRRYPIFDGILQKADLPEFYSLLLETIDSARRSSPNFVDRLLTLISANHYSISKFIIMGLCELGCVMQALSINAKVIDQLPHEPKRLDPSLLDEHFTAIFTCLKDHLEQTPTSQKYHRLLMNFFWLCQQVHHDNLVYVTMLRAFVRAYVASPYGNLDELNWALKSSKWLVKRLALDPVAYDRAKALGVDTSKINDDFVISWTDQT